MENHADNGLPGRSGQRIKMFRDGYLSVCIFRNIDHGQLFYDTVIYRKIKESDGQSRWIRGANFKPADLDTLARLIRDASTYLEDLLRR
jgi:hypothetical protein